MIAVGVGCRKNCPGDDIVALVRQATALLPRSTEIGGLFCIADKRGEAGLHDAARALNLSLTFLEATALRGADAGVTTRSARAEAMFGVSSIAEAAALAGAGPGSRLLVTRQATARVTCAIAGPLA